MPIPNAPITGRLRATPAQPSSPAPLAPEQENKRQKGIASVETAIELLRIIEAAGQPIALKDIAAAAVWVLSLMVALVGLAVFANALLARL